MKRIVAVFLLLMAAAVCPAYADGNTDSGYFENTRKVLVLPVQGHDAAEAPIISQYIMDRINGIFRYPYYEQIPSDNIGPVPIAEENLKELAEKTGADIIVIPELPHWYQWSSVFGGFFGGDEDPIVTTECTVRIASWSKETGHMRIDEESYYDRNEEGIHTQWDEVMDDVLGRLLKKFPYARVPRDRGTNLSGPVTKADTAA